jgi:raffinose/stachyose/melibiose transport system substrate-binding protein
MRKRLRKSTTLAAVLATALLGVVAAGAGGAGASPTAAAAKQEDVTITLGYVNTVQNAWVRTIQDFEHKYPNIKVKASFQEVTAFSTLLATQLQAGNAPDIFTVNAGTGSSTSIAALAPANKLLDLTSSPWVKRIPSGGRKYFSHKNKVYGWPMAVSTNGVFYNTDLFRKLKLSTPKNLKDFYALCPKIKAAGKTPIALGFAGSTTGISVLVLHLTNEFVYGQDKTWVAKRIANKVTFASSPLWRALFQSIDKMNKSGCFNENPAGTSYPNGAGNLVASGQAVMEFLSGGTINSVTSINPNINYAMFQLPPDNSGGKHTVASVGFNLSVGANAATKHPEEVRKFLNYAADANVNYTWATNAGSIAALNATKGLFPSYLAASAKPLAKAGRLSLNQSIQIPNPGFNIALTNNVIGLLTGQQTVSGALSDLDKKWPAP